jgi:tripartite-type tricarboxylate transporter receptor subunit TctC
MRRHWSRLAGLSALAIAFANPIVTTALAQPYPNRVVRIISDSSPGSAVDTGLRVIAEGMSRHWKQQVVIVNQPGAGGAISATVASQAAPDGYTLYAPALSVFLAVPGKAANLPLMIPRDFMAIGYTVDQPLAVGVAPKLGIKTLPALIDLAKKQPGKLAYAVTGVGRLTHLTGELLQMRTGIVLQMVPYSGNSAQAITDVYAGRIPIMIEGYTGLSSAFDSGHLIPLAVGSPKRLPSRPNLPTISETVSELVASGWQAMLAPNGTPPEVIANASAALRASLGMGFVKDQLAERGSFVRPMSPEEVTQFISAQQQLWGPAIAHIEKQMKK